MRAHRFLRLAYKLTYKSTHRIPMAAIAVAGHRVLSRGTNRLSTHPAQVGRLDRIDEPHSISIHAELAATLCSYKHNLNGATLYLARRLKDGSLGIAKPCEVCYRIIKAYGFDKVVYSFGGTPDNIEYRLEIL